MEAKNLTLVSGTTVEWMPVETAPKDGTRILLYREGWAENVAVCWWSNSQDEWEVAAGLCPFYDATHWIKLPTDPEQ